jgi:hypothetical protein
MTTRSPSSTFVRRSWWRTSPIHRSRSLKYCRGRRDLSS